MNEATTAEDKIFERQYLHGGYCAQCGEACKPFVKGLPEDVIEQACVYNGNHPDCGNHKMVRTLKASQTLGNYEIWECANENCDWTESY